jgi:hypothetical protein
LDSERDLLVCSAPEACFDGSDPEFDGLKGKIVTVDIAIVPSLYAVYAVILLL